LMEKKMWSIFGGLTIVSFVVSPIGQKFLKSLTPPPDVSILDVYELPRPTVRRTAIS